MSRRKEAEALFSMGFNCAQAILASYGAELGVGKDIAFRLSSALGAGVARTGQVCGAVTWAIMVLGLRFGSTDPEDEIRKEELLERASVFV